MAVTNLVKDQQEDHAVRIALFAIEAIAAANDTLIDREDESKGCVNIRVGKTSFGIALYGLRSSTRRADEFFLASF